MTVPTKEDQMSEWQPIETAQAKRHCAKCGEPTGGEEAYVDGLIYCHPCADTPDHSGSDV